MNRARAFAATFGALMLVASVASAQTIDARRAQADADAVLAEVHAFCDNPRRPPNLSSYQYCSLAKDVPNCAGYVKQCEDITPSTERSPDSDFLKALGRLIAAIAPVLGWIIAIVAVSGLLYLLVRALLAYFKQEDEPAQEDGPLAVATVVQQAPAPAIDTGSPEAILARAEAALARGDLRAALFGFLHAALRALDVRGAVRIARDRTNGEYVRSCSEEAARPDLRAIVIEVDGVQFGGRAPDATRIRAVGDKAARLVRGAMIAMLMFAALLSMGCKKPQPGDDPGGFDVAPLLLARQGFTIKALPKSLARLEDPKRDGEQGPLVIDLGKTILDKEAQDALERWVKAGGTLVLFGSPVQWPNAFETKNTYTSSSDFSVLLHIPEIDCDDNSDECEQRAVEALQKAGDGSVITGKVARPSAFEWVGQKGQTIAQHDDDHTTYASVGSFGDGRVIGVANSDLLTNIVLARPGNPAALIEILSHIPGAKNGKLDLYFAGEHQGITPVSNPIAGIVAAGLGWPLLQALLFTLVLACAVGARYRAARPNPMARRRAFVEHVEATGALYAHARAVNHALASFARFAIERLRLRVTKGGDIVGTLATRTGASREECQRILDRAQLAKAGDAPTGDELATLRALADLYVRASDPMSPNAPRAHKSRAPIFRLRRR